MTSSAISCGGIVTLSERRLDIAPLAELSMRSAAAGGPPRSDVKASCPVSLAGRDEVVLFIHGFNVAADAGRQAYAMFQANLPKDRRIGIYWVLWPGDQFSNNKASALAYSWMPQRAKSCALKLATFFSQKLEGKGLRKLKVYIVAHSLGCRLALEFTRNLSVIGHRVEVQLIVLMAAAIPVYMIRPGQDLDLLEFGGAKTRILFSKKDAVLKHVFRLGQRFESNTPTNWLFGRHALGRKGLPNGYPGNDRISQEETRLGHGEYWGNMPVARSLANDFPSSMRQLQGRKNYDSQRSSKLGRDDPVGRVL